MSNYIVIDRSHVWASLILGTIFFLFSNGNFTISLATWLAPVFLIYFARSTKVLFGLSMIFVAIALSSIVMLHGIVPSSLGVLTHVLILYYALLWFVPYWIDRLFTGKIKGFAGTIIFPLTAVTCEYMNMVFFGSWASTAYTQSDHLPLLQIMSVTGMWGVSFLVLWMGPVINWAIDHKMEWSEIRGGSLAYASILGIALIFGGARLVLSESDHPTVHVGSFTAIKPTETYVQSLQELGYTSSIDLASKDREELSRILQARNEEMIAHSRKIALSGAAIVLWAEGATTVPEEDEMIFLDAASEIAIETKTYQLVAYLMLPSENPSFLAENKCVLIDPDGDILWIYLKAKPVPGSTDKPGNGIVPVSESPYGRLSSAICYDMDFTGLIRTAGRKKVDIMLVPAWDWKAIDPLHAKMAAYRAIENGFSMVRQTGMGLSLAVDPFGRVLSSMDYFDPGDQVMHAQVPVKGVSTIYAKIGDLFPWACIVVLLAMILVGLRGDPIG